MKLRKLHKLLGMVLFVFLLNAALSGVMRANARSLYWKDRPPLVKTPALAMPGMSLDKVFEISRAHFSQIKRIELKPFLDRQIYQVDGEGKKIQSMLLDASTGEILSPLKEQQAVLMAQTFVASDSKISAVESLPAYRMRKANQARPVYRILFDDAAKTEIFVDQENGNILNLLDRGRRFGMLMVRLHELEFPGLGHNALTLAGIGIVILCLTGLGLALSHVKF